MYVCVCLCWFYTSCLSLSNFKRYKMGGVASCYSPTQTFYLTILQRGPNSLFLFTFLYLFFLNLLGDMSFPWYSSNQTILVTNWCYVAFYVHTTPCMHLFVRSCWNVLNLLSSVLNDKHGILIEECVESIIFILMLFTILVFGFRVVFYINSPTLLAPMNL